MVTPPLRRKLPWKGNTVDHGGGVLELDISIDVEVICCDGAGRVGEEGGPAAQVEALMHQGRGDVEADAGEADLDADGQT